MSSATGTGPSLKRLKRDRPDLADKVVRGELSANAAAIEAGFRKKLAPLEAALRAYNKLTPLERAEFWQRIGYGEKEK